MVNNWRKIKVEDKKNLKEVKNIIIFLILLLIFMVLISILSKSNSILNNKYNGFFFMFLLLIILTIVTVFRLQEHDTLNYIYSFKQSINQSLENILLYSPYDYLWNVFQFLVSRFTDSEHIFLFIIWSIFIFGLVTLLIKLFSPMQATLVLTSYACYTFFYSYSSMAIRQGLAISMILIALSYLFREGEKNEFKKNIMYVYLVLSFFLHWTSLPFSIFIIFINKFKLSLKATILFWIFSLLLFIFNIQERLFSSFATFIPKFDMYSTSNSSIYYSQNTYGFVLFSSIWVILFLLMYFYFFTDNVYENLIKIYIGFNSIFLCMSFVSYSDRIAGYSWFLIPIILWYPILKSPKSNKLLTVCVLMTAILFAIFTKTYEHFQMIVL